jgi:hypothetical protein
MGRPIHIYNEGPYEVKFNFKTSKDLSWLEFHLETY